MEEDVDEKHVSLVGLTPATGYHSVPTYSLKGLSGTEAQTNTVYVHAVHQGL